VRHLANLRRPAGAIHATLLTLILIAYGYLAVGYARATPRWNNPDEPAHFNYIRHVARTGTLPVLQAGDWDAALLGRLTTAWFPNDYEIDALRYEGHQPPLYYVLGAAVYRLTDGLPLPRQVLALKLLSIVLGGVVVVAAYVVARELAPTEPLLAPLASVTVAFVPMFGAISAAINNDSLANALAATTLAALAVGWRRGFEVRGALGVGVLLGLLLLTKLTVYVYVPLALVAIYLRGRPGGVPSPPGPLSLTQERAGRRSVLPSLASGRGAGGEGTLLAALVALAVVLPWLVRNVLTYGPLDPLGLLRHDAVVVGQPRWSEFVPPGDLSSLDFFARILFRSFWGVFGWMGVILDDGFYVLYLALTLLALAGLAMRRIPGGGRTAGEARVADVERVVGTSGARLRAPWLLVAPIALVFGEVAYYNLTFVQPQGRYLFPALVPLAVGLSAGWCALAESARSARWIGGLPAALLAATIGWSVAEWHGAVRAREPWTDNGLVLAALATGVAVAILPAPIRSALPPALIGLLGLALGLLDYAALVRFVAPAFPVR